MVIGHHFTGVVFGNLCLRILCVNVLYDYVCELHPRLHTYVCTYTCTVVMCAYTYANTHVHMHTYMHVCMRMYCMHITHYENIMLA